MIMKLGRVPVNCLFRFNTRIMVKLAACDVDGWTKVADVAEAYGDFYSFAMPIVNDGTRTFINYKHGLLPTKLMNSKDDVETLDE